MDSEFFAGTCYQATNWVAVGKTKGRGRLDREHQSAKTVKAIYVYPLQADFRARMGVPEPVGLIALQPCEGLDGDAWASQELARDQGWAPRSMRPCRGPRLTSAAAPTSPPKRRRRGLAHMHERAIAIRLVIGWRIRLMTLLGRTCPELPAEILFSDIEIEVLAAYAKKKQLATPKTLGAAVRLVARLGGHIGRRKDPPPGHEVIWRGQAQLITLCEGFVLSKNSRASINCGKEVGPRVRSAGARTWCW